jgi:hypothetical protein
LRTASIAVFENGLPLLPPGKTKSLSQIFFISSRIPAAAAEGDPVLTACLHPRCWHDPDLLTEIDFFPPSADNLAYTGSCKHENL